MLNKKKIGMKKAGFLCFILAIMLSVTAQGQIYSYSLYPAETDKWCFGGNGGGGPVLLDFSLGTPVAGTSTATGPLNTGFAMFEGGTSIADTNGQLLFYTSGNKVYNRNHQLMPNGGNLIGNMGESASQGSIIIRQPGSFTKFYLFTTPDITNQFTSTGFRYHVIDITLDGGLGDVVSGQMNIELFPSSTEKVCAVLHRNGEDVWILGHEHNTNRFLAYLLTEVGLVTNPVTSNVGVPHAGSGSGPARGCMKFSPNGRRVALAISGSLSFGQYNNSIFEVLDFNPQTGVLSNPAAKQMGTAGFSAYGVEFSPDDSKIYVDEWNSGQELFQYNVCAGDNQAIINSEFKLGDLGTSSGGSIQMASDGKVYIARLGVDWLGVINNPNELGVACNFVKDGIALPEASSLSLPNFNTSYFNQVPPLEIAVTGYCVGDSTWFEPTSVVCSAVSEWEWNFGDPGSGAANTDTLERPFHIFSAPGNYQVTLIAIDGNARDTITKDVLILPELDVQIFGDTFNCLRESGIEFAIANVNNLLPEDDPYTYEWSITDSIPTALITSANTETDTSITVSFIGTADSNTIQLVIKNTMGCSFDTLYKYPRTTRNQYEEPNEGIMDTICYESVVNGDEFGYQVPDTGFGAGNSTYTFTIFGGTETNQISKTDSGKHEIIIVWTEIDDIDEDDGGTFRLRLDEKTNPGWKQSFDTCLFPSEWHIVNVLPKMDSITVFGDSLICEYTRGVPYYVVNPNYPDSRFEWEVKGGNIVAGQGTDTVKIDWLTQEDSKYWVTVKETSPYGCEGPLATYTTADTCYMIPNVFTPNGDGINDNFYIKNMERYPTKLKVFNRWGHELLSREPYVASNLWEGKDLPSGVYFYKIDMMLGNGWKSFTGTFTVLK